MKYTMTEFKQKMDKFSRRVPTATKRALITGTQTMKKEMQRRYLARLSKRTGELYEAIQTMGVAVTGKKVFARVGVGNIQRKGRNRSMVYKAATHERGATRTNPGGHPYIVIGGKAIFLPKNTQLPNVKYTKPSVFSVPKRPFVQPAKRAKLPEVRRDIVEELLREYKRA